MKCNRLVSGFLALSFLFLSACSTPEEKKEKHYLRAMEYVKLSDDKAAILELRNAIQLDAKYADARYQLGILLLKAGDAQGAFSELQRAFSLDPNNADAGVKVAEFFLLAQNKEESRTYVQQVLNINPEYPDALALLANLELIDNNFEQAEKQIDQAIQQLPTNDKFHSIRGRILSAQERWEESEKEFQKAIELNPESFANYRTLLMYYEQRKDEAAMRRLLDIMTPKFPNDPQLYILYAALHQKKGELDQAEQAYLQAIEMGRQAASFRLMLVDFYKAQQQYGKAEEYLKKSLAELPDDIQLQGVLAELLFDMGKLEEAHVITEGLLKSNPRNGAANLLNARFLIKEGKNAEAVEILTPLTADYPKWGDPFYYTALSHLQQGKIELAQRAIETAVRNTPNNDRYLTLAAQINLLRGNGIEAGQAAASALRINPRNFAAGKILVQSLVLQKDFDKAIKLVESVDKRLVEQDVDLLGAVGVAYLGKNDKAAAIESFTRLLKIAPDNTKALSLLTALKNDKDLDRSIAFVKDHISKHSTGSHYILLGDLYLKKGQDDLALQAFEKAQELNPADPLGYILHARLLHMLGKTEESIAQYNELLVNKPQSIPALMGLATALESQGKIEEAKAAYQKILDSQPDFPAASNNLAWLIVEQNGDLGEALRLAMQAKQAMPNQPNISDTLGWIHYKRESYNLAISQFKHALAARPDDPTIGFHLALAQYAVGEKNEAIALLQEIVARDKQFKEWEEASATLQKWQGP